MMSTEQLTDKFERPLRDLRISVTDRCNFRCPYCMPAEIFHEKFQFMQRQKLLTFEEIERLTRIIVRLGAVKLRLTGGEPLVRQKVDKLVTMLINIDGVDDMAMTTNAFLLPKFAQQLKDAGLQRFTVSLDSLNNTVFRHMNGERADVQQVLDGIQAAKDVGFDNIKINCVVQRGVNDHTLVEMARWARDNGHILRFIEYMDVGTMNGWQLDEVVPAKEIAEKIDAAFPIERVKRHYASETALRYVYKDGVGEIGIIASVSMPFCGNCSRMRLSPEGKIYTCLFATEGTDLKTPLRAGASDDEIEQIIRDTWGERIDRYSEERTGNTKDRDKIEMYYIG
ncbi:MAG: GTP 3',8-cyclase MoaA, partial [Anaerolineae bacterium]|nr:GTP 3',8-cyclase MoaA [Anaerolineae bacterium]